MITEENITKNKPCRGCGTIMDYERWLANFPKSKHKVAPLWWGNKHFCTTNCCTEYRRKQTKPCYHCGTPFHRKGKDGNHNWAKKKFCSKQCSLEYGYIIRIAKAMGLTYEQLKPELLKIAEKYSRGR